MKPNLPVEQFSPTYRFHQHFTDSFFPIQIENNITKHFRNPVTGGKETKMKKEKNYSGVNNNTTYLEENNLQEDIILIEQENKRLWKKLILREQDNL